VAAFAARRPTASSEEGGAMSSPVVHFQICAEDVNAMSAFYREVFGWRIDPRLMTSVEADVSGTYPFVEADEGGITGGITGAEEARGNVLVVEVQDVGSVLRRVEELGGHRRHPEMPPERMTISGDGGGTFELGGFEDPEGNLVYVIHR
jgi:predicted enzyme related to lactoylglutathione lyase